MRWTLGVLVAGVVLALPTAAAGDVTATLQGTTIVITGTDGPDTISVTANAGNVDIDTNGVVPAEFSFPIAGVTSVVVNLGAANDAFVASGNVSTMTMTIDGGAGDDTISGGNSADTVHGGDGADTITPGQGSDSVFGDAGPDTMAWNPGDNSDTFAGGDGIDRLVFTGANVNENIAVAASGTTALLTRDIGNVTETLQQVELIDISMLGGTDHYTAGTGLAAAGLQHISVDGGALADTLTGGDIAETLDGGSTDADIVSGGAGDDTLIAPLEGGDTLDGGPGTDTVAVAGTDHSETFTVDDVAGAATVAIAGPVTGTPDPATSAERVQIDALGGNDTVLMTAAAQAGVALVADGGDGDDTINGSAFGDVLHGGAGNDVLRGFGGDDQLFGDAGDDLLIGGDGADGFHCGGVGDAAGAAGTAHHHDGDHDRDSDGALDAPTPAARRQGVLDRQCQCDADDTVGQAAQYDGVDALGAGERERARPRVPVGDEVASREGDGHGYARRARERAYRAGEGVEPCEEGLPQADDHRDEHGNEALDEDDADAVVEAGGEVGGCDTSGWPRSGRGAGGVGGCGGRCAARRRGQPDARPGGRRAQHVAHTGRRELGVGDHGRGLEHRLPAPQQLRARQRQHADPRRGFG
jgi:Ca2+-binding RTX toxin-like protein